MFDDVLCLSYIVRTNGHLSPAAPRGICDIEHSAASRSENSSDISSDNSTAGSTASSNIISSETSRRVSSEASSEGSSEPNSDVSSEIIGVCSSWLTECPSVRTATSAEARSTAIVVVWTAADSSDHRCAVVYRSDQHHASEYTNEYK